MKKFSLILTTVLLVAASAVVFPLTGGAGDGSKKSANQVRVAAILNLTGPSARYDADKQKTMELALERLKELYPNLSLQFKLLDAGGSPETTTVAVRRARTWGTRYLLSGTSPTALTIAAQVRGQNPPVVQLANAANPDFGPPRLGEYRFWPDWVQEAEIVFEILQQQKLNSVLLIHSADPYSEALTKELNQRAQATSKLEVRDFQYDPAGTPDFRPAILRAKADGRKALVVFGLPPGIRALIAQMAEAGWNGALIGGVNINLAAADYAKAGLPGPLWLVETEAMHDDLRPDSEAHNFRSAYKQKYGEGPPFHALYLADALYFVASAWATAPDPKLSEVERVRRVRRFDGASGLIEVNEDRSLRFVMAARKAH